MPATIRQIAEELGLSQPTVSHVLNNRGRFRDETRQRVFSVAQKLGYVPNGTARAMRLQRTNQIGVLVANTPSCPNHTPQNYFAILGLNDGLQEAGYILSIVRVADVVSDDPVELPRVFRERILDGVVVLNASHTDVEKKISSIGMLANKTVWADADHWSDASCIRPDEFAAGRLAAEALVRGGARRLVWLYPLGDLNERGAHYSFADRMAGVDFAAREAGVEVIKISCAWANKEFTEIIQPYLCRQTGLIAYDVARAQRIASIALPMRICPGEDFGLVTTEFLPDLEWNWPQLTYTGFDRYAFGVKVAEMILRMLNEPKSPAPSIRFPCSLAERMTHHCG